MKRRKLFLLAGCFISVALFSGCWNYREVDDLIIVSGLAVDKKEDGYLVTAEIVDMLESGKESTIGTELLSMEGASIFDAARNMIKIAGKRLYFSHAEILIISEEIAEEGIIPITDWVSRDNEPRYTMHILVSKEKTAKEILEQKSISSEVLSFELNDMLSSQRSLSNALDIEEWQFLNDLSGTGISAVLPMVDLTTGNSKPTPEVTGTAVFKEDRLVGFLDGEETKTLLFIKDKIKGGLLTGKKYKDHLQTNISLEILKNRTKLKPRYTDGIVTIEIITDTDVAIGENGGRVNYIDEAGRLELKEDFEGMLENKIAGLVKKVQEQYDSDIFGFGKAVKLAMPGLWKQIEPQWLQIFKSAHVEVRASIHIKNSALASKPVKVGD